MDFGFFGVVRGADPYRAYPKIPHWAIRRWARIKKALGPRDDPPPIPVAGRRAERALLNLAEALPVFLTVAVLLLVTKRDDTLAQQGALIFVISRVVYVPSYISGVIGLRSACWLVGWIGLTMMIVSLLR